MSNTEQVRMGYVLGSINVLEELGIEPPAGLSDRLIVEFDRWYFEEIRKAKAQAWDEGSTSASDAECGYIQPSEHKNPYTDES